MSIKYNDHRETLQSIIILNNKQFHDSNKQSSFISEPSNRTKQTKQPHNPNSPTKLIIFWYESGQRGHQQKYCYSVVLSQLCADYEMHSRTANNTALLSNSVALGMQRSSLVAFVVHTDRCTCVCALCGYVLLSVVQRQWLLISLTFIFRVIVVECFCAGCTLVR